MKLKLLMLLNMKLKLSDRTGMERNGKWQRLGRWMLIEGGFGPDGLQPRPERRRWARNGTWGGEGAQPIFN